MTTCQRLEYFHKTVKTFFKHCLDADEICRVIVSDDRSSEADRLDMLAKYPDFEFVWRSCGHPASLRPLFEMVNTEFFFHLEDDRPMLRDLDLLSMSIQVMNEAGLDSFISGLNIGFRTNEVRNLMGRPEVRYYIHKYVPDGRFCSEWGLGDTSWPGFYLAPGLHRTRSIQSIPYEAVPQHERSYALRYEAAGRKVAFNCGRSIFGHLTEISAYKHITHAPR
jgi:hypothetical protein